MLLRAKLQTSVRRVRCPRLRIPPGGIRATRFSSPALHSHVPNPHTQFLDDAVYGTAYKHSFPWHTPKGAPRDSPSQIQEKQKLKHDLAVEANADKAWDDAVTARLDREFARLAVQKDGVLPQAIAEEASTRTIADSQESKAEWQFENFQSSWGVPTDGLNLLDSRLVAKFNVILRGARKYPYGDKKARELNGLYAAVKRRVPNALELIPDGVWKVLWRTQSMFRPMQPRRLENMRLLVEDMTVAGRNTSRERMFLYLEELAHSGKADMAAQKWERAFTRQGLSQGDRKEWLELGARLHAYAGDIDRACALVIWAVKHHKTFDPRCMLFVVWKNAETGDPPQMRHAWAIYQKLKAHPSFIFHLHDYRSLVSSFLQGGHVKGAVQVLTDLATNARSSSSDRAMHVAGALEEVRMACKDQQSLSEMMLKALTFLPDGSDWSHFFRKWLDYASQFRGPPVDHCAQIIELMFELGHEPDATHLNQLIRVWMRCDDARRNKALEVAWDMVHQRLEEVVSAKDKSSTLENQYMNDDNVAEAGDQNAQAQAKRASPSGNARTFTILARHYAENEGKAREASRVLDLLGEADLPFSKRVIRDILQIQFHIGNAEGTWAVFERLRRADIQSINLHIYNILWRSLSRHISLINEQLGKQVIEDENARGISREEYFDQLQPMCEDGTRMPGPRALFADMVEFIRTRHDKKAEPTPKRLLDHLTLSLLKAKDVLGAYVAMKAFRSKLSLEPGLATIDSVVHYTALQAATNEEGYTIRQGKHLDLDQYKDMAYSVLEHIFVNDAGTPRQNSPHASDLYDNLYIQRNGNAILSTLTTYLHRLLVSQYGSKKALARQLRLCQIEMGVYVPTDIELQEERNLEVAQSWVDSLQHAKITVLPEDATAEALLSRKEREKIRMARELQAERLQSEIKARLAELGWGEAGDNAEVAEVTSQWAFDETPVPWTPLSNLSAMPFALDPSMRTWGATQEANDHETRQHAEVTLSAHMGPDSSEATSSDQSTNHLPSIALSPQLKEEDAVAAKTKGSHSGFEDLTGASDNDFALFESDLAEPGTWKPTSERYKMSTMVVAPEPCVDNASKQSRAGV